MRLRWLLPILLILALAVGSKAQAQILFAGGEYGDFICNTNGGCGVITDGRNFRSSWAREAYYVNGDSNDPPVNRFATPTFTAGPTIWVHAQYCNSSGSYCSGNTTTANEQLLRVMDNAGNPTLIIRGAGTAGTLKISSRTSGGTFTDLVTCSNALSANAPLTQLDLYVNYGTSGEVTLYINSQRVCDYTGNITNGDGATTLDAVEFAAATNQCCNSQGTWSEVIIATTDTRAMNLYTLAPNGNGNATQWTGTNPCTSILNATGYSDPSYVYTGSNNQIEECTVTNSVPPGSYNVQALIMSGRLLVGASGPQHFDFVTRTGAADYMSSDFAPTNSFGNFGHYIQTLNPATSNPWAVSDFTASGFNIGLESKP